MQPGYTVLPVSVVKTQATPILKALLEGKTVYISNRGRVVAAFRPYSSVPDGVAALHASPFLNVSRITATDLQKSVPSTEITLAAGGLPSLVEKNGRVLGILTSATAPRPTSPPDIHAVGAKSERVRAYQIEHSDASIDEVMDFYRELEPEDDPEDVFDWRLQDVLVDDEIDSDAVADDLEGWREDGSQIEDDVLTVLNKLEAAIVARRGRGVEVPMPLAVTNFPQVHRLGGRLNRTVKDGEQLEANGETVLARAHYFGALVATSIPNIGVMYRMGNIARLTGRNREAAHWFRLTFAFDALEELAARVKA